MGKPLKRLRNDDDVNTGLKPGENEIELLRQSRRDAYTWLITYSATF
jgi:hypothetical protein